MRFIDLDLLIGDGQAQPLIDQAEAARSEILAAADEVQRSALIDQHRAKWTAFRAQFERLFGAKCWYVECKNPGTDDDIDHFRPKGRLADDATHGGYWWEALHWRNFRLSCHRANRLRVNPETDATHGKGDHFPLFVEPDRCRQPADDLARERPTLLDPTDPGDPGFLTFDIDGSTAVSADHQENEDAIRKVNDSRVYLHLDWPRFKEDRQSLYRQIRTWVLDGDQAAVRLDRGEPGGREAVKKVARDLIRLTAKEAPYSRAARAYVRVFRENSWVKQFVIPNIEAA